VTTKQQKTIFIIVFKESARAVKEQESQAKWNVQSISQVQLHHYTILHAYSLGNTYLACQTA